MAFWILATLLALIAAGLLVLPLARKNQSEQSGPSDVDIYKTQLAEIESDAQKGILSTEEAEQARTEIARRLLAADKSATSGRGNASRGVAIGAAALSLGVVMVGGTGLYLTLGAPGAMDLPRAERIADATERYNSRPSQSQAEAAQPAPEQIDLPDDLRATVERVRQTAADNPTDLAAQRDVTRMEIIMGNSAAAARSQAAVIDILGADAAPIAEKEALLELMAAAAGGTITPESERVLRQILDEDPDSLTGLYWVGVLFMQNGRPDRAFTYWDRLLRNAPADAPWVEEVQRTTADLAWYAGREDYTPPAPVGLRGPTAEDMENAADMDADAQAQMIQGMVNGLMDRLATDGGTPDEWAQLIRALGVLGETDRAAAIWGEAQQNFAATPEALDLIRSAATDAGVAQ